MDRIYDPKKLNDFLNNCQYSNEDRNRIIEFFEDEYSYVANASNVIRQVLAKLDILYNEENEYYKIFEFLTKNLDLSCNILEVGGGHYPILSEYIDMYQRKIGKGSITVMDPTLVVDDIGKVKLIKEPFNKNTDTVMYDKIIGVRSCETFDDIIKKCAKEGKEFFFAPCSCIYRRYYGKYSRKLEFIDLNDDYDPIDDIILRDVSSKFPEDKCVSRKTVSYLLDALEKEFPLYIDLKCLVLKNK